MADQARQTYTRQQPLHTDAYFLQRDAKYFSADPTANNGENRCAERIEDKNVREVWNKD